MWSISLSRLPGSILARRTTFFASAMLVAVFTILLPAAHTVGAQGSVDTVTWSGDNLNLQLAEGGSTSLSRSTVPPGDNPNIPNLIGSECQDNPNIFFSAPGTWTDDDEYSWLYIVCLSAGDDGSDKSQPLPAMLLKYRAPLGTDRAAEFNEREEPGTAITIPAATSDSDGAETITTCDSTYTHGLGWAICPITNWLAAGMDALYNILIGFLSVPPLTTDREGPIHYMWGLMRNAANILFIAGFLIIIYSQTTSIGLSNYGIKRLLPRLAIAAVLVNTSYWVAAIAVDISNILGVSLQNLLIGVRESIPASEGSSFDTSKLSWQAIATAVLTGGSAGMFVVGTAVGSFFATAGGSLWFLLVGLAGVMLSVLVAILILAARQALITILIIISPLAFVAYLLPATESYFQRWRSLFTTMLVMFPIFSLIFGGSQLAGLAIIHTADPGNDNFFTVVILGMIVQVAPVIITPMLIKLSGSLLGRIAGFVNNPNRGIVDQTRKFAQRRQDMTKNRQMWDFDKKTGRFRNNNPLAQVARWNALRSMDGDQKLKTWEGTADAHYAQDRRSRETHKQSAISEIMKSEGEDAAKAEFANEIMTNRALQRAYTSRQASKSEAELAESRNKTLVDEMKTKPDMANVAIRDLANRIHDTSEKMQDETQRQSSLTQEYDTQYWREFADDTARQAYAGAAGFAEHGETRVANIARQKQTEEREKRISAAISNLNTAEAKLSEERAIILGNAAGAGQFANLAGDLDSRSGALRRYIERAPIRDLQSLHTELDITLSANGDPSAEILRSELAAAFKKRKPFYISQTILNKIEEGTLETRYGGAQGRLVMIGEALNASALGAQAMVTGDRDDLASAVEYLNNGGTLTAQARDDIIRELDTAFTDPRYRGQMEKRIGELSDLRVALGLTPRP